MKVHPMLYWEFDPPPEAEIQIEAHAAFDARGMRRVYGRGDIFTRRSFDMHIWRDRNGTLLARFTSNSSDVDEACFAIYGISDESIPARTKGAVFLDAWIPKAIRDTYENWVCSES